MICNDEVLFNPSKKSIAIKKRYNFIKIINRIFVALSKPTKLTLWFDFEAC